MPRPGPSGSHDARGDPPVALRDQPAGVGQCAADGLAVRDLASAARGAAACRRSASRRPSAGSRAAAGRLVHLGPRRPACRPRAPRRRPCASTTVAPQRARSGSHGAELRRAARRAPRRSGRSRLRASRSCASKPAWMRAIRSRWLSAISPVSADQAARSSCVSPGAGAIAWPLSEPSTVQIASTSAIESDERRSRRVASDPVDGHLGVAVDDLGGAGDERDLEPGALLAGCPAHAHPAPASPPARAFAAS